MRNSFIHPIRSMVILILLLWTACDLPEDLRNPLDIARAVSDKVIRDTEFSFELVPNETVLGMQVIDFGRNMGFQKNMAAYALSYLNSEKDTLIFLGMSSSGPLSIEINTLPVISLQGDSPVPPVENSYNRFDFEKIERVHLKKGNNKILIRSIASQNKWTAFIRALTPEGDWDERFKFTLQPTGIDSAHTPWLLLGPVKTSVAQEINEMEKFSPVIISGGEDFNWFLPKQNILMELAIDKNTTYKRESYLEWHYANGALLWSMLKLPDLKYGKFVKKSCDFAMENLYYFRWQYKNLYALRGSYHRIFRRTMLDDAGAPILPYAELMMQSKNNESNPIVKIMADFVHNGQQRLDDGTFCRPEPVPETVWADDLFMSVPLLLQLSEIDNNLADLDDAARQIENFYSLLFDRELKLCFHGWYNVSAKHSPVHWGRANGWMFWAISEALLKMPPEHMAYQKILDLYREHAQGIAACQDQSGMWHQVLDYPESYEETSCTAMFILVLTRGIRNGWLDAPQYTEPVKRAWGALKKRVDKDGTVHGICRGTGIGDNLEFYFTRQTFDHDPRGLGAVITAALEVSELNLSEGE